MKLRIINTCIGFIAAFLFLSIPHEVKAGPVPPIEGYVRNAVTNAPISGVWVKWTRRVGNECNAITIDSNYNCPLPCSVDGSIKSRYVQTDASGHFYFDPAGWSTGQSSNFIDTNLDGTPDDYQWDTTVATCGNGNTYNVSSHFNCVVEPHEYTVVLPNGWPGYFDQIGGTSTPCEVCFNNGAPIVNVGTLYYHPALPTPTPTAGATATPTATPTPPGSCSTALLSAQNNVLHVLYQQGLRTLISGQTYNMEPGLDVTITNVNRNSGASVNMALENRGGQVFGRASTIGNEDITSTMVFSRPLFVTSAVVTDNDPLCNQQGMRFTVNGTTYTPPTTKQFDSSGNCIGKGADFVETGVAINQLTNTVVMTDDDTWHYSIRVEPCGNGTTTTTSPITPASCNIYMIQDDGNADSQIVSIDTTTKVATPIGSPYPGRDFEGLDIDPTTRELYTLQRRDSQQGWLFRVDAATGALFPVGFTGSSSSSSMSFKDTDGTLWLWYYNGLYKVDKTTGIRTLVYSYSIPAVRSALGDRVEAIAWNTTGTTLYAVMNNYGNLRSELWAYNPSANTFTFLSDNLPYRTEGLEMRPDGYLMMGVDNGSNSVRIVAYDVTRLEVAGEIFASTAYNDAESLAWSSICGVPFPVCSFELSPSSTTMTNGSTQSLLVSNITGPSSIDRVEFTSDTPSVSVNPASDTSAAYSTLATAVSSGTGTITAQMFAGGSALPVCSATATITVSDYAPWWQAKDTDVISNQDITSPIPGTCVSPSCSNTLVVQGSTAGSIGVVVAGGSIDSGTGSVSPPEWSAKTSHTDSAYTTMYFENKLKNVTVNSLSSSQISTPATLTSGTATNGYYYVKYDGNNFGGAPLEITNDLDIANSKVILIVINADLEIQGSINIQNGSGFFMTIVEGEIQVDPGVGGPQEATPLPDLEGIYFTESNFTTGTTTLANDTQLHIRGSVVALDQIILQRNLSDNTTTPAELFELAPDVLLRFPQELADKQIKWQEVAP